MQEDSSHNANLIINKLRLVLNASSDKQLAEMLSVAPNTISAWRKRNTVDFLKIIEISAVNNYDLNYILRADSITNSEVNDSPAIYNVKTNRSGIPVLPIEAMAGKSENSLSVHSNDVDTYIDVPFLTPKPEFVIKVIGDSMYPTIQEGDYIACRAITLTEFIPNKPYLITIDHAPMVKRLIPGNGTIICKSDNAIIKDFEIGIDHITSIHTIVGIIREKLG